MAAPTSYYCDPSLGSDTGDGTVGTPWGRAAGNVVQWALDSGITRDATDGDRLNIKSGGTNTLAATLSLTTYGTPTETAPFILAGYTASEGDGGVGLIDGNGSYGIFAGNNFVTVLDMHITNGGAATIMAFGTYCLVDGCEIDNGTGHGILMSSYSVVMNCHVHNIGKQGIYLGNWCFAVGNYLANGANDFNAWGAIRTGNGSVAERNIISIDGSSFGIYASGLGMKARYNTILASSGSGIGIDLVTANEVSVIENNYIEGFSSGSAIDLAGADANGVVMRSNRYYNNATHVANKPVGELHIDSDNSATSASAIDKSGSDTYANRATYFAPTEELQGNAHPTALRLDIGAVQHADAGSGPITYLYIN